MFKSKLLMLGAMTLVACGADVETVEITDVDVADLPQEVRALVEAERAGFDPQEIEKKVRDGRVYYDIEGELPDGSEIEFDVLMTDKGPEIVEIQRDLMFGVLPDDVKTLAMETSGGVAPERIIESVQTDGAVIYEFFAPGEPSDPAYEIRVDGDGASVLDERWEH